MRGKNSHIIRYVRKDVNEKNIKAFGKRLAVVRKSKNITQEDLSYQSGLTLSQIARIETGVINTTLNTILILANALEVEPKELFDFSLPKEKKLRRTEL
jgi:transcriptional regulator with XRE-family HTH domain